MTYAPSTIKTETVTTHDLREGDVIIHYGAKLALSNRKDHGMRAEDDPELQGATITFDVKMLDGHNGSIYLDWLDEARPQSKYHVQGNKLAKWSRVIEG